MAVAIGHIEPPDCNLPMFLPHNSVGSAFQFRLKWFVGKCLTLHWQDKGKGIWIVLQLSWRRHQNVWEGICPWALTACPTGCLNLTKEVHVPVLSQYSQFFKRLILNCSCMPARPKLNYGRNEMLPLVWICGMHTLIISRGWHRTSWYCLSWQSCFHKFCPCHQLQHQVFFSCDGTTAWHYVRVVGTMGHCRLALWMFEHVGNCSSKGF